MDKRTLTPSACDNCRNDAPLDFDFSFAFQPIVDSEKQEVVSYEALVRGKGGEPAAEIFKHVNKDNLYRFDQQCRVKAIELATRLGLDRKLNINFLPNAVYDPHLCIRTTLAAAKEFGFPTEQIVFEVVEAEEVRDHKKLANIIRVYQELGFQTAIDDFGAGYAGLNLLAEYQPHIIKLDRNLISNIDQNYVKQSIVRGVTQVCHDLKIRPLAEGVETREEYSWLQQAGIRLYQGYYFSRPAFEALPQPSSDCFELTGVDSHATGQPL